MGAGSVVFRRRGRNVQIFFVKNAYGRWTFPKGKQDLGEALAETAVRETREEAGLTGLRLIAPLGRTTFRFQREGQYIQKTVHFFLFEAPPDAQEKMTGVEGGMWEAQWVPVHRAIIINGYRNLDLLLSKAIRLISLEERRGQHANHSGIQPRIY